MAIGLVFALFLIALLVVATSSWSQYRLDVNAPLDVETGLPWPSAGFGSSSLSLSGLFGAFATVVALGGVAALTGVLAGVFAALLLTQWRVGRGGTRSFQNFLTSLRTAAHPTDHLLIWIALVAFQVGLAVSELTLLRAVFEQGLGLTHGQALAAALLVALVCYYYCLLAGYQAVFRTDVVQYLILLVMCGALAVDVFLHRPAVGSLVPSATDLSGEVGRYLLLPAPIRGALGFLLCFSLGMIPVIGAPDAWKRLILLRRRGRTRSASLLLLLAAVVPVGGMLPAVLRVSGPGTIDSLQWGHLFSLGSFLTGLVLLLGMTSVFMSTFDSALMSSAHLLLVTRPRIGPASVPDLKRYRIILALVFLTVVLASVVVDQVAPHPYALGLFLAGPVSVVLGLLVGTRFFSRPLSRGWVTPLCGAALALWVYFFLMRAAGVDPAHFVSGNLVTGGVALAGFWLFAVVGWLGSRDRGETLRA